VRRSDFGDQSRIASLIRILQRAAAAVHAQHLAPEQARTCADVERLGDSMSSAPI